jgi:hypothetical protein
VKALRCRWAALVVIAVSGQVFADSSIDSRVQKLEEAIRILEGRVASLEGQLREGSAPARVAPDKVSWRNLKKGMSEGDVERLLGSPSKVVANPVVTTWYYDQAGGQGNVDFDSKGTVRGWIEP